MTSLKTSIKTITYLSDTGCLEIQGASLSRFQNIIYWIIHNQNNTHMKGRSFLLLYLIATFYVY